MQFKTTLTLDMSGYDFYVSLAFDHSAALKRFKQTIFVALNFFAATPILSQDMTSDQVVSANKKLKSLYLSTNTRAPRDVSRSQMICMVWRNIDMSQLLSQSCRLIISRLPNIVLHSLFYQISKLIVILMIFLLDLERSRMSYCCKTDIRLQCCPL